MLSIRNAAKRFGQTEALRDVSLNLRRGEWLGLLGPNGAGKTTLVRSVSGRVRLDRGELSLLGQPVKGSDSTARDRLGVVPQELAIYPLLTARENLHVFGRLHGVSPRDINERADWALAWTGLGDRASEPVKRFSGGMKRRLNIACAVLHKPQVVLLDEPTVGVDPQSRQRIWEMLDQLRTDGASLLLTTHQLDEAQQVCERIVIIDHGSIIADGSFDDLVREHLDGGRQLTITFVDTPPTALVRDGAQVDGNRLRVAVTNVAHDLARLMADIEQLDAAVRDVHIEAPSLQAVFIHLTGRELRE